MLYNKKGAALLQVLLLSAVLAGMATMLLRASLSRTNTSRQMRRAVSARLLISRCQAEVNVIWSAKTREAFDDDLKNCRMKCKQRNPNGTCKPGSSYSIKKHTCTYVVDRNGNQQADAGETYTIEATFTGSSPQNGHCALTYTMTDDDTGKTEVIL